MINLKGKVAVIWGILLLFGGGLSIAKGFQATRIFDSINQKDFFEQYYGFWLKYICN
jgi:di/tricarboxylate transporter